MEPIWPSIGYVALGLSLFLLGLGQLTEFLSEWDLWAFRGLNRFLRHDPLIGLFRLTWPLGTTPFALLVLLAAILTTLRAGILALLVYSGMAVIEVSIKRRVNRPRPFGVVAGVVVHQPTRPVDASFPSGDAFRAWFLALALPLIWHLPGYVLVFFLGLALLVALGRIALGVHYPLDVVGGMGIGIFAFGILYFLLALR